MITLCKLSKWYPDFQVLKHCSTEAAKGEVWSCAVRGALASRRSSNASMDSSRSRKASSRSPAFPSAGPAAILHWPDPIMIVAWDLSGRAANSRCPQSAAWLYLGAQVAVYDHVEGVNKIIQLPEV
jgi:hypothetical protein